MPEIAAGGLGSYLKQAYNPNTEDKSQVAIAEKRRDAPRDAPVQSKSAKPSVQVEISAEARALEAKQIEDSAQDNVQFDLQAFAKQVADAQSERGVPAADEK